MKFQSFLVLSAAASAAAFSPSAQNTPPSPKTVAYQQNQGETTYVPPSPPLTTQAAPAFEQSLANSKDELFMISRLNADYNANDDSAYRIVMHSSEFHSAWNNLAGDS